MRALVPRLQTRIMPSNWVAEAGSLLHSASLYGAALARVTGVGVVMPSVTVTPLISSVSGAGPPVAVRCNVEPKALSQVEAPTVLVHGPPWSVVPAPGPELPA